MRNTDGTFGYKTNDEVSGIATDKDNHPYIFFYVNNAFVDSGTGIPRPRAPYNVYGTDVSQLIPVDGGVAYPTNIYFKGADQRGRLFYGSGQLAHAERFLRSDIPIKRAPRLLLVGGRAVLHGSRLRTGP